MTVGTDHHHPLILATGRHGSWAQCSCGWRTERRYHRPHGASVAWADHLAQALLDRAEKP